MRFRSDPAQIRGSIAPVVSPFTADGDPDTDGLRALSAGSSSPGSHGISIGGSTGEPSAQSDRRARRRHQGRGGRDRRPGAVRAWHRLGQAGRDARADRGRAAGLGADAALVITPYYARPTQEGLFHWYATVAREFPDLPIIAYNVPSRTAVDIAPETVARLRRAHRQHRRASRRPPEDFEHFSRVLHVAGPRHC